MNGLFGASLIGTVVFPAGVAAGSASLYISTTSTVFADETCTVNLVGTPRGGALVDPDADTMTLAVTDYSNSPYGVFSFDQQSMNAVPALLGPGTNFQLTINRNHSRFESVWVLVTVIGDSGQQVLLSPGSGVVNFTANQASRTVGVSILSPNSPQSVHSVTLSLSIFATVGLTRGNSGASVSSGVWVGTLDASGSPQGIFRMSTSAVRTTVGSVVFLSVQRSGGVLGAVNVSYQLQAGSGLVSNYSDLTNGLVKFANQQQVANISVMIINTLVPAMEQTVQNCFSSCFI